MALDVDLVTGEIIRYPGNMDDLNSNQSVGKSDPDLIEVLKGVLKSDEFKQIRSTTSSEGCDGVSYLIEVNLDGVYSWKCHWCPHDQTFLKVVSMFKQIDKSWFKA